MATPLSPAAGYKFNSMQEIKSHSSVLFNERISIIFYLLDMRSIRLNTNHNVNDILEVRALMKQIYKNIRTLIRNNPMARATLNLETKDPGVYITDVSMGLIDRMIEYCESYGYSVKKMHIIVDHLNEFEMLVKDVLQYFHYFIRPDFRQKPDVDVATEKYKAIADKSTIDELKAIAGKKHLIDFASLGTSRVDMQPELEDSDVESVDEDDEDSDDNLR